MMKNIFIFFSKILIAKADTDLSKFDAKEFPKKKILRQAWGKLTAFWNKIGQSISASEKSLEVFGINKAR
jgi:hypothetical protein